MDRPLLIIAGPTGSGKSSLALDVAERERGEIVNCDSMQLYRGFDIGTAKTPVSQRRGIPHQLFDVLDPTERYSAGEYARTARAVIAEISARGAMPIVVGGTGFYLRALLNGLPELPMRDEKLRERLIPREQRRAGSLHKLLMRLDPRAATRIHANDTQKLVRALEIRLLTRRTGPTQDLAEPLEGYRILKIGLNPDRTHLYGRLDERVQDMFASGLIEEVRALLASGATGKEKPFESLGYKQALRYLRGECALEPAIEATQIETRQYAKRQWTWFRRDSGVYWVSGFGNEASAREQCLNLIHNFFTKKVNPERNEINPGQY